MILRVDSGRDAGFRSEFQKELANVSGNYDPATGEPIVNGVDASRILQAAVGLLELPFNRQDGASALWRISASEAADGAQTYDLSDEALDKSSLNFIAGVYGDVSGNWIAPIAARQGWGLPQYAVEAEKEPTLTMEVVSRDPVNGTYSIEIAIDPRGTPLYSVALELSLSADTQITGTESSSEWFVEPNGTDYQFYNFDGRTAAAVLLTLELSVTPADSVGAVTVDYAAWGTGEQINGIFQPAPDAVFDQSPRPALLAADADDDGIIDRDDLCNGTTTGDEVDANGCAASQRDTDDDGLTDAEEIELGSDPLSADSDNDGLADGQEVALGTSPTAADTDGDGWSDSDELDYQTDPLESNDQPVQGGLNIGILKAILERQK